MNLIIKSTFEMDFISIPIWSDFNANTHINRIFRSFISIPRWSDFNIAISESEFNVKFQSQYGLILIIYH